MLGIVVSRPDEASVAIGEQLRAVADWQRSRDEDRPDAAGGGPVYRTAGAVLREFDDRHLDLAAPAEAFEDVDLLVFASKHAGETGRLLTAHHTGNFGPAEHGGAANALARACPNAHARVLDALETHAPSDYEVGLECTHHGPTTVGVPSMFVEVGSGPEQWADTAATRAVARAILDLRGVEPDAPPEPAGDGAGAPLGGTESDALRRHLVGFGGGHYAPRFERIVRETDWAVGHVAADWGVDAMPAPDTPAGRALIEAAFDQSGAHYGLVAADRPAIADAIAALGYRAVGETWVRETDGVPLCLVARVEAAVTTVDEGLRFGERAADVDPGEGDLAVVALPSDLLSAARGIDQAETTAAIADRSVAYDTDHGGSRPAETVVVPTAGERETLIVALADVLRERYDSVERDGEEVVARETTFSPEKAATLGVPEGPAFGRLASGESVEVDGRVIDPAVVSETRIDRFSCR